MSKAAERLYCSQPALSKQVKALEKELGYPVFLRRGTRLELNENGKLLYRFGKELEQSYNTLRAELYRQNHCDTRGIRLGVTNYIGTHILPPALKRFKKLHPEIPVRFAVDFHSSIIELLNQDQIDFAFVPEHPDTLKNRSFYCEYFGDDPMVLVFPPGHPLEKKIPIRPADLEDYPFLISQATSASRSFILSRLGERGVRLSDIQNMYNIGTIKQSVINGLGISILSQLYIKNELKNGSIKAAPVKGMNLTRRLYIVRKSSKVLSDDDERFIRCILSADRPAQLR